MDWKAEIREFLDDKLILNCELGDSFKDTSKT